MKATQTRCCAAWLFSVLGSMLLGGGVSAQVPDQHASDQQAPEQLAGAPQGPEKLVAALSSKDWHERNQAAAALCAQANKLSRAVQSSLWQVVVDDVSFFEKRTFQSFERRLTPRDWSGEVRAEGYFAVPEVQVPASASDLAVPIDRQVLALLVLQQITNPHLQDLSACLKAAENENSPAASQMLYALLGRYGDAATKQFAKRLIPGVTRFLGGKELVGMMSLLPHLGESGWSLLHDMATAEDQPMMRRAAMRVIGMSKRDVDVDLFVARRMLSDPEAVAEACGVLVYQPASDEDPALVDYLIKAFAREERSQRMRILAILAYADLRGRAAQVRTSFLVRALGSDELQVAELALTGLQRTVRQTQWELSQPAALQKLIGVARGGNEVAMQAIALLRQLAVKDDRLMARLLDDEILAVGDLRKVYRRYPAMPPAAEKRLDEAFRKAVCVGDGENQVRLARAFVKMPWLQVVPAAIDLLRAELQSGDAERVAGVSSVVSSAPKLCAELAPQLRELTGSEQQEVQRAAWLGLVWLVPEELPAAIEAKHVGRWDARRGALLGPAPRAKLIALFDNWDKDIQAAAVKFLARDPAALPDLIAGLQHTSDVVRKECLLALPRRIPAQHRALFEQATKRLRTRLADTSAVWSERMESARMLMELVAVASSDVDVLCGLAGKLKLGKVPQKWNSSVGLTGDPLFLPPTRWEVFTEVERLPATNATIAWLQQAANADKSHAFRGSCRDLLLRFLRRDQLADKARDWFSANATVRGQMALPKYHYSLQDARALVPPLYDALRDAARKLGRDTLPPLRPNDASDASKALAPSTLQVGDYEFPYVLLVKGEKPSSGWPLFLCMHGGGGNGKASGPHAWSVNTREWQAQKSLFESVYEPAGIYFIPRMADDRRGRWWHDHNQIAFERVIEQCLLFREADPNRVYLMGISEGGYGAIRFAGNRPDRFAATGGMAAAEPISTSPPENMRNVAMRIDIGEKDTRFDRVGLARRMGERLAELQTLDPDGYDHSINIQAGRGHGIDYSLTPKWLAEKVRQPRPKRVVWTIKKFDSRVARQHYWLALDAVPDDLPWFVDAKIAGNRIEVTVAKHGAESGRREPVDAGRLLLRLDDRLVDLDYDVHVVVNGRALPARRLDRSFDVMLRTMAERSDPEACYAAEIAIDLASSRGR